MSTQQDIYAAGSENCPLMLNKDNYVPWSSRLLRYAKRRPNEKLIYNSIMNGPYVRRMIPEPGDADREVPVNETFHEQIDDELIEKELKQIEAYNQAFQTILLGLPKDIYAAVDSCKTAQEIWLRVQQMMKGSDIGIQEKKAKLFNEWERFTSTDGESIESYYHRFSKLMNDFKRNKHFPENIASNLKFLNNLQPERSRHVTIVHQTKDLHTTDYTQLYDLLKYNQKEVDDLRAKQLAKTHDPLALMENSKNPFNYPVFHLDQPSPSTYMQQPLPNNNNYNPQPSFNQNYMQQPMPNPEDITDPTIIMNMALHGTYCSTRYEYGSRQTDADGLRQWNQVVQNAAPNLVVQHVGNQNGLIVVLGIANQNPNGNEAGIQLQAEEFDLMAATADLDEIKEVNANCILMANLHRHRYTELFEPIPKPHQVQQNDSNVISQVSSVEQDRGTVDQHPATVEETHAYFESLYNNLAIEVQKFNTVNHKLRETNADLTTELARYKNQEKCFEISQENMTNLKGVIKSLFIKSNLLKEKSTVSSLLEEKKKLKSDFKIHEDELLDKQIQLENKIKELDNILVKIGQSIQTIHMLSPKPDSFYHTEQEMDLGYQNPFYLKQAQQKQ
ncbi:hypothetical protein Tco_0446404 [Tanacetum coccineum]